MLPPIADTEDMSSNRLPKLPSQGAHPMAPAATTAAAGAGAGAGAGGDSETQYAEAVPGSTTLADEGVLYMCGSTMGTTTMEQGGWGYEESTTLQSQDLMASTTGSVLVLGEQTRATAQIAAQIQGRQQQHGQ